MICNLKIELLDTLTFDQHMLFFQNIFMDFHIQH